ncbi:HNH endonuclease [Desulfopila inferna]|nr:HNH endonuclease [Desulfopila inferna]
MRKTRWWQQKTSAGKCWYCGRKTAFKDLTMDHLVPLARGGKSTRENIVPSCKSCNTIKKSMLPLEWQEYLERKK